MRIKCQCCGIEKEFTDPKAAFAAGWDVCNQLIACDLCPMTCLILGKSHAKAHAFWAQMGRPTEFSVARCGNDDDFTSQTIH